MSENAMDAARRFADETWGKAWAHAEMGSLLDFAALAAQAPKQGGAGAGWRVVPVELSRSMLDAVAKQVDDFSREHARLFTRDVWASLLAAAPNPPAGEDGGGATVAVPWGNGKPDGGENGPGVVVFPPWGPGKSDGGEDGGGAVVRPPWGSGEDGAVTTPDADPSAPAPQTDDLAGLSAGALAAALKPYASPDGTLFTLGASDLADVARRLVPAPAAPQATEEPLAHKIIEVADCIGVCGSDWALTIEWPDGTETLEHVSNHGARALGYSPDDEDDAAPQAHIPFDEMSPEGKEALGEIVRAARATMKATEEPVATDDLVDRFAVALKAKLRASEAKYGWRNGWLNAGWEADCQRELVRHVGKGDPLDVAAYAAFSWHHGWFTLLPNHPADDEASRLIREAAELIRTRPIYTAPAASRIGVSEEEIAPQTVVGWAYEFRGEPHLNRNKPQPHPLVRNVRALGYLDNTPVEGTSRGGGR